MIRKEALPSYGAVRSSTRVKKHTLPMDRGTVLQEIILLIFCFLIGRAVLFQETAPFGIALFAVLLHRRMGAFSAFLAVSAGLLSYRFGFFSIKYITAMALVAATWNLVPRKRVIESDLSTALAVLLALSVVNMMDGFLNHFLVYGLLIGAFESLTGFMMVFVFSRAADVFKDQKRRRILSGEEIICISILLSLAVIGFWNISILGLSLRNMMAVFMILLFAAIGGAGVGASMGITVGFVLSLATSPDPMLIGNLAVCGLIAGTFKEWGRLGAAITFLMANVLMTFYINQSTFIILPFWEIAVAVTILLMIPTKGIGYLKQYLDYSFVRTKDQQYYVKRMQELTVGRLKEFSQVFFHLSKAFGRISERKSTVGQEEISKLFDLVADQVCKDCALYRGCWQRDFYNTYSNMFELLAICDANGTAELSDMPQGLKRRCLTPNRLVEAMNSVYAIYRSNLQWQERIDDCRHLVAEQLEGISEVVTQLAAELNMDIRFKKDIEDSIHIALDKQGIRVKEVLVLEKAGGRIEVGITKNPCQGKRECVRQVEKVVSSVMGKPMTGSRMACTYAGKEDCTLHLTAARQYEVMTGVARRPKELDRACGDSYSFAPLKDGKYLLALSDGMGTGARAAEESSVVISLLENFLEAGFGQDITIRTINSILMLRSREEIFATVDLCMLDLVQGNADFIKIGGVSAFIRQQDRVQIIRESSLPIGILEDVQLDTISAPIEDEDMIILVTDGILDAFSQGADGETSCAAFIASFDTGNPQELADILLEKALSLSEGEARDDMTVMATRIWKPYDETNK